MLESITWGTYIFFAAFCLLALAFTFFFIPETRGKVCAPSSSLSLEHLIIFVQTLEDMDLIFGDTAAHEEKKRIKHIEAQLRGTPIEDDEVLKPDDQHAEMVGAV
jgi:hypothetical protein